MKKFKTGAATQSTVGVLMESEVARQVRQHSRTSMKAEVCGVLIGKEEGSTTIVEACIAGANAAQGGAHVTFTQDTWEHIYQVKDKTYPDHRIVGWYHSHPGFGIFLSDHDLFIHQNFFSSPQQIAWVFDPHTDEEGCFGWHGDKVEKIDGVAFTFGQPCGESVSSASEGDENIVKVNREAPEKDAEWMPVLRDAAMCLVFFVIGAAAAFFYITNGAILLPKGGSALVIVQDDKVAIVPPDLAMRMLTIMQNDYDTQQRLKQQAPGTVPGNTGAGATGTPQGEPNGRQK